MEELTLIVPDGTFGEEIAAYRQAFLDAGDSMDGCGSLRRHADPKEWLAFNEVLSNPDTVPENWVPSTQYVCVRASDRRIVGMLQIRQRFNDYLENYGGHIGYSVRPDERRKGYAKWMLAEALPRCRALGLERVLVTCLTGNEGSRRTLLANGGRYECTVHEPGENVDLERYWIEL